MDTTGWIILGSAIVYLLGILGTVQILGLGDCLHEGFMAFLRFSLGVILWPTVMPMAGLAWLFGTRYWVKQRGG